MANATAEKVESSIIMKRGRATDSPRTSSIVRKLPSGSDAFGRGALPAGAPSMLICERSGAVNRSAADGRGTV